MTTKTKYRILAVIICIVIYLIYLAIAMSLGWKHGGGVLILALLFGIISWVWQTAGEMAGKADAQKKVEEQERLLEEVGAESVPESAFNEEEVLPTQPVEPFGDMNPKEALPVTPLEIKSAIQLELNGILKALFLLWMVVAGIHSIGQFVSNIEGSYAIGAFDLAFAILGITSIAGMCAKKRWGLFVAGTFYILQLIFCLYIGDTDASYYDEAIKVVIRVIVICGLLFIRKDGHSAWETIWHNGLLNPVVPLANDGAKGNMGNDDLPPIPEEIVDERESKERACEMKESVFESPTIVTKDMLEHSSEEIHTEDLINREPPISRSEEKVEDALKILESSIREPHTNSVINNNNARNKKSLILVSVIFTLLLSGGIAYSLSVIPKNRRRKAAEELYLKGSSAYKDKLYELAVRHFADAAQIDSTNWGIYYMLGNCYYMQSEYRDSYYWYEKAYEYNPKHTDVVMCGDTLHYEKYLYRYSGSLIDSHPLSEKSLQIAQEYYTLYKDKSDSYRLMIFAHLFYANSLTNDNNKKNKHLNTSLLWANKMVEDFPDNNDSYFCLAYVQADNNDNQSAIVNYKRCIELNPKSEMAYNNLGLCYEEIGSYNLAGKCYEKAIQLGEQSYAPENLKDLKRNGRY